MPRVSGYPPTPKHLLRQGVKPCEWRAFLDLIEAHKARAKQSSLAGSSRPLPRSSAAPGASFYPQDASTALSASVSRYRRLAGNDE